MDISLYDKTGILRFTLVPSDSSTQQKEIQGDNILSLSFTLYEHVNLDVNDYVDYEGERYWLTEAYQPAMKGRQQWQYDIKLYGIESMIKRFLVLNTTDGDSEPVFTLTAPPADHVKLIVQCINNGMDNTTNFKVGVVQGTENVVMDYEGTYCDEALKTLAEKVSVEWWMDGETINLSRCERGESLTLAYGKGLDSLERDTADTDKFYSRLYPIGSTRNIDPETYGYSRLMLPGGTKYVDVSVDKYGVIDHYEADAFAGIYPRRIGVIASVRSEEATDDDGNTFKIYYVKDNSLPFNPDDYMLSGKVLRISFQEGSELAGLGDEEDGTYYFECNYHSDTKEFEIITIWPYDDETQLPNDTLVPKAGDKYILWNLRMPDEYYTLAEEELAAAVDEYNAEHALDISVYKGHTDHVWIEDNDVDLYVGRLIRLESSEYFQDNGYRDSRITKLTRRVNLPSVVDLEISDALSTSGMQKLSASVSEAKSYAKALAGALTLPDIIRSWDTTTPSDSNLYSARRTHKEFLSKNNNDRAAGKITFVQGVNFGELVDNEYSGSIDGSGNAELLTAVVRSLLRSAKFVDGLTGEGWQLWIDSNGLSNLTIDKLTVRQVMTVLELLIEKIRSIGGQLVVSAANGKIASVELSEDGTQYTLTFEQGLQYTNGDLIRCQTFTGGSLKSYWVQVVGVWGDHAVVEASAFDGCVPEVGDETVLMGNTSSSDRQNLILISATEDGQPRIDVLDKVSTTSFSGCLRARLGCLDGIKDDWFPSDNQPQGYGLYSDNAYLRGTFLLVTGEDILTKFEITEGKIESAVEGLRQDFTEEKGYLNNPTFYNGMSYWQTEDEAVFFLVGNKWIWANGNVLSKKGNSASVVKDNGRTVVHIRNKYIMQTNANLRDKPSFQTNDDGEKEAIPVYLSFYYRCAEAGTLRVEFENVDKTGFANFNSMEVEEELAATDGYAQYTCNGLWNGTGDFKLSFTGEIYLYMLVLSTDKIESLTYKYKTLFEQSERLVKISAAVFDKDENALKETGLFIKPEGAGLYAQSSDGTVALIGVSVETDTGETDEDGNAITKSVIKLTADNIQLEGLVTANENFKIKEDGSIEAANGTFSGTINAEEGTIGGFIIANNHIGVANVSYEVDENGNKQMVVSDDNKGLYLYDKMIGFNDTNRQAILGTWDNLGQPMLVRLIDTAKDSGYDYSFLPKYGIVFDIENSVSGNFAFVGKGNGVLNGFIDGYKYKKVEIETANTIYDVGMTESNRIIVNSTVSNSGIALPRLSSVRTALGIGKSTSFAVRCIINCDLGSNGIKLYGRNSITNSSEKQPWNNEDYPLLTNWNGGRQDNWTMEEGDTIEVLLVYDPDRTDTIDDYTTQYTARTINRQD